MNQMIDAIYENGVFRPQGPVNVANGERVSLMITSKITSKINSTDLADVADLLDVEYMETCYRESVDTPSLEETRKTLNASGGSLSDLICQERDER
jgi:predicted DNA-binding antitoxin AbrB/MazE fold protein